MRPATANREFAAAEQLNQIRGASMDSSSLSMATPSEKNSYAGQQIVGTRGESLFSRSTMIAWLLAGAAVLLQMLTNGRYGYFRDELYFLACSDHLDWGYVDFAPLVALLTRVSRMALGDSLPAIRFLPALAHGAEIVLTGLITRELGGKRFAIFLACVCVWMAPVVLNNATRLSMNPFEPLFWMGCIYFLLRTINGNEPKLLVCCGVMLGLGLQNKHSTAFFFVSLLAGLLGTPSRRLIFTKWFWIAAAVALLLFLPHVLWQGETPVPPLDAMQDVKETESNVGLWRARCFMTGVHM